MYPLPDTTSHLTTVNVQPFVLSLHEMFRAVHGGRSLHHGAERTYLALCARYPGHGIPLRVIQNTVSECPICQKDRLPISHCIFKHTGKTGKTNKELLELIALMPASAQGDLLAAIKKTA